MLMVIKANKMEVIKIPQKSINDDEKLKKDLGFYLCFYDDFIYVYSSGDWTVEDEKLGIDVNVFFKNQIIVEKNLMAMETCFNNETGLWQLQMNNVVIAFENERECQQIFEKIIQWKFNTKLINYE